MIKRMQDIFPLITKITLPRKKEDEIRPRSKDVKLKNVSSFSYMTFALKKTRAPLNN